MLVSKKKIQEVSRIARKANIPETLLESGVNDIMKCAVDNNITVRDVFSEMIQQDNRMEVLIIICLMADEMNIYPLELPCLPPGIPNEDH